MDDWQLLRQYLADGSRAALEELVRRHLAMVYAAALRETGDGHLAEDVTQAVFLVFLRKARGLSPNVVLAGWLFNVVRYVAASQRRAQARRQRHEAEVAVMKTLEAQSRDDADQVDWQPLIPRLNDAIAHLPGRDRAVVVMKYLEGKSHREVAAAQNTSENAVRQRLFRAMQKLRVRLQSKGVPAGEAAVAAALAAATAQACPPALAESIGGALAAKAGGGGNAAPLAKATLWNLFMFKLKILAAVCAACLLLAGGGVVLVHAMGGPPAAGGKVAAINPPPVLPFAAREFNSKLPLHVYVDAPNWGLNYLGSTPAAQPIQIPACFVWWVKPAQRGGNLAALAQEVQTQAIPGLEIYDATDGDLVLLRDLRGLQWLYIPRGTVTDTGLVNLKNLTGLHDLNVGNTNITDAGLENLKDLKNLRKLGLHGTKITSLDDLSELKNLELFDLMQTAVTDAGLEPLKELRGLQWLNLSQTKVTDAGLVYVGGLKELEYLDLRHTLVTEVGVAELQKTLPKCRMVH